MLCSNVFLGVAAGMWNTCLYNAVPALQPGRWLHGGSCRPHAGPVPVILLSENSQHPERFCARCSVDEQQLLCGHGWFSELVGGPQIAGWFSNWWTVSFKDDTVQH